MALELHALSELVSSNNSGVDDAECERPSSSRHVLPDEQGLTDLPDAAAPAESPDGGALTITKLQPQRRKGRFNLFVNGEFVMGVSDYTIAEHYLYSGKIIRPEDLQEIQTTERRSLAFNSGYRLCERREHSVAELRRKMSKSLWGKVEPEDIEWALSRLQELGIVNDARFAIALAEHYYQNKHFGERRIVQELRKRGVAEEIIRTAIEHLRSELQSGTNEALRAAFQEAQRRAQYKPPEKRREFVLRYLVSRGHSFEDTRRIIDEWEEAAGSH